MMEDRILQMALMQSLMTDGQGDMWRRSMRKLFQEDGMDGSQLVILDQAMDSVGQTIRQHLQRDAAPSEAPVESEPTSVPAPPSSNTPDSDASSVMADPMDNMARLLPIQFRRH